MTLEIQSMTLRQARNELNLNIGEMSSILGIHRETYSKWERGERKMPAIGKTAIRLLLEATVK